MFDIQVKPEIAKHCVDQIQKYNFGQRRVANGTPARQLTGIIGQSVIMDLFGLGLVDGETGFDGGTDIIYAGINIDVKTMGRTTPVRPFYVNNFIGLQLKLHCDVYIFCSLNKLNNVLTVCGWITKKDFLEKASFFPKGSMRTRSDGSTFRTFADLYEIENGELNDVDSFEQLKEELNSLSLNF